MLLYIPILPPQVLADRIKQEIRLAPDEMTVVIDKLSRRHAYIYIYYIYAYVCVCVYMYMCIFRPRYGSRSSYIGFIHTRLILHIYATNSALFTDGLYTKGTRAHTHRELI